MKISYSGFNKKILTFADDGITAAGVPVKTGAQGATPCDAGDSFLGICESVREGVAGVQCSGYVECKYSGTTPLYGRAALVADGTGGVKQLTVQGSETIPASQRYYDVIMVNSARRKIGFII